MSVQALPGQVPLLPTGRQPYKTDAQTRCSCTEGRASVLLGRHSSAVLWSSSLFHCGVKSRSSDEPTLLQIRNFSRRHVFWDLILNRDTSSPAPPPELKTQGLLCFLFYFEISVSRPVLPHFLYLPCVDYLSPLSCFRHGLSSGCVMFQNCPLTLINIFASFFLFVCFDVHWCFRSSCVCSLMPCGVFGVLYESMSFVWCFAFFASVSLVFLVNRFQQMNYFNY